MPHACDLGLRHKAMDIVEVGKRGFCRMIDHRLQSAQDFLSAEMADRSYAYRCAQYSNAQEMSRQQCGLMRGDSSIAPEKALHHGAMACSGTGSNEVEIGPSTRRAKFGMHRQKAHAISSRSRS